MVSTEITILARSSFITKDAAGKDIQETRITYQMPDGRIGSVTIPTSKINTPDEDKAIATSVKTLPSSAITTRSIDIV
jgi:hypothetical protein